MNVLQGAAAAVFGWELASLLDSAPTNDAVLWVSWTVAIGGSLAAICILVDMFMETRRRSGV